MELKKFGFPVNVSIIKKKKSAAYPGGMVISRNL